MTIRKSLFLSTFISVFAGFLLSSIILIIVQNNRKKVEIQSEIERLTELVCTSNVAYAWGYDSIGLQQSIEAMVKDPQITSIQIIDSAGLEMGSVEQEKVGNIYEVTQALVMDGTEVGTANISFSDHYLSNKYLRNLIDYLILEVCLFAIVIIVVMISTGHFVKRPIKNLIKVVEDMAHGEGDLTVRIPVTHHNELAVLSSHFNSFIDKLHTSIVNLQSVGVASQSMGENLDSSALELSGSITNISRNMNEVNDRIASMNDEMQTSEANVSHLNDFIYSVADMIKEQSQSVNKSSVAIENMVFNITEISSLTEKKLSKVEVLEKEAARLEIEAKHNVSQMIAASETTEEIMQMVSVINNIASKTNLLAMNAAIEAAHAGNAGKGFSVVASEIRNLAEQTAKNSSNIQNTISEIIDQIGSATQSSQDSSTILSNVLAEIKDVAAGLSETIRGLQNISQGNTEIIETLEDLNRLTKSVTTSSEEMRSDTAELKNSISKIMAITNESRREIDSMAQGLSRVSDSMVDLTHLSKDNSSNIEALETEIGKFKV